MRITCHCTGITTTRLDIILRLTGKTTFAIKHRNLLPSILKIICIKIIALDVLFTSGTIRIQYRSFTFDRKSLRMLFIVCNLQRSYCHSRIWFNLYRIDSIIICFRCTDAFHIIFIKSTIICRTCFPYFQILIFSKLHILGLNLIFHWIFTIINDHCREIVLGRRCQCHIILSAVTSIYRIRSICSTFTCLRHSTPDSRCIILIFPSGYREFAYMCKHE